MTKTEYMRTLAHKPRRLPKEDYDKAMEYFEEYFAEAGPEFEQQAIEDLGSPEDAANQLIIDLAAKNVQEPPKTVKRGLSAIWIGILGICAAPIALPLGFALLAVFICFLIVILAVIFCLFLAAVAVVASGIIGVFGGGILLFSTFADGLATIGLGLFALGAGVLLVYGAVNFCRWFLGKTSKSLGNISKGGKKNESNH